MRDWVAGILAAMRKQLGNIRPRKGGPATTGVSTAAAAYSQLSGR